MITKKQIFESSKGKQSIEVRKRFVEQIMKIVNGMPDIEKNTKSFESNAKLLQSNLSENNLKHYFNSEKKSNSFSLFKFLRDAIDFYFEAKNSDENNAQKIYDKILKSKTNLKLDKSFKISSIEKNDAKIIFPLIENIHKKSISLLNGKFSENISSDVKKLHDILKSCINEISEFEKKYSYDITHLVDVSDISKLENCYTKALNTIKQNKKYFLNSREVTKDIQELLSFLKIQKDFWGKFPYFNREDCKKWRDYYNKHHPLIDGLYIASDDLNRYLDLINYNNRWYYRGNKKKTYYYPFDISAWDAFYGTDNRKVALCRVILIKKDILNLIKTLCTEIKKPVKSRKPLDDIQHEYKYLYSILRPKYNKNGITPTNIQQYSNMTLTIPDINSREFCLACNNISWRDYGLIFIEGDRSFYKKANIAIGNLEKWYYDYNTTPKSAFDARKIGKAETTEDIDAKTKNKENRRSLNLEI